MSDICARKSIGYRAQLFYTHITLCETYEVFIKEPRAQALYFLESYNYHIVSTSMGRAKQMQIEIGYTGW